MSDDLMGLFELPDGPYTVLIFAHMDDSGRPKRCIALGQRFDTLQGAAERVGGGLEWVEPPQRLESGGNLGPVAYTKGWSAAYIIDSAGFVVRMAQLGSEFDTLGVVSRS